MKNTPVTTQHPEYTKMLPQWELCRDLINGWECLKSKAPKYFPPLHDQSPDEYKEYINRGYLINAFYRTLQALTGAILRKPPQTNYPTPSDLQTLTSQGENLYSLTKTLLTEIIGVGRTGILLDLPKDPQDTPKSYFTIYQTENIINWKYTQKGSKQILTLVTLKECYYEEEGEFGIKEKTRYRVLKLQNNVYVQQVWEEEIDKKSQTSRYVLKETITPTNRGQSLNFIPFCIINYNKITVEIVRPPMMDIGNIQLSHTLGVIQMEHGCHYLTLPQVWVAGFPAELELRIGATRAWVSPDPDAKAGFLEFKGQGLGALKQSLDDKMYAMAILGSRLLDVPKKGVEAAETYRIRNLGEGNFLLTVVVTAQQALSQLLEWKYWWDSGGKEIEVEVTLNTDFDEFRLAPQEMVSLVQAYQSGTISLDTLLYNFKRGEILPPGVDEEEELEKIQNNLVLVSPPAQNNNPEEENRG